MRRWLPLLIAAAVHVQGVAAQYVPAHAGLLADRVELRGTIESEVAVETSGGDLQKWDLTFEPELTADLGSAGRLTALGRMRLDPVDELEPGRDDGQSRSRSAVSRRVFAGDWADFELRELYLDKAAGDVFLRLGKQQVVWGEADGLRVLDQINPLSFREFILPDFEDRRIPLWMANVEIPIGDATAQLLWIPDHTYDEIPEAGSTFEITSRRFVPQVPAGFSGTITVRRPDRPKRFLVDDDYGMRVNGFTGGWDWSLNYLFHYQDQPAIRRTISQGGNLDVHPEFERTHLIGGTASNAFNKLTLRTEVAYSTDRVFITSDAGDADGVFETGEASYVLGLDYQYDGDTFVSGQGFQSLLVDDADGVARDRLDSTLSLLASREFVNDTIKAQILYLQSVNDRDGLVQVDLTYELRSDLILALGADMFFGSAEGVFGQFDSRDRITTAIEYGF